MRNGATVSSPAARSSTRQLVKRAQLVRFFADIGSRMERAQTNSVYGTSHTLVVRPKLEHFFSSVNHRVELAEMQQRRIDKRRATGFNVFHLIEPDENKLSDILADLLDPKGDHGQGDLFLRLLFKQLGLRLDTNLTKNVTVQREAPTHGILKYRRRMDVFVEGGVLLAIENKMDSLEQRDQVRDYMQHLQQCARSRQVTLIYLTPDGRLPKSLQPSVIEQEQSICRLHCWSYQRQLRVWLESCRRDCEAQKIRHFLSDFIVYIESALKRESKNNQGKVADEN
jgi:PD-(D/E)XK nuclease superfamily